MSAAVDDSPCMAYNFYSSFILISRLGAERTRCKYCRTKKQSPFRVFSRKARILLPDEKKKSMPNRCVQTRSHNLSSAAPLICHSTRLGSILNWYKNHNKQVDNDVRPGASFDSCSCKHVFSRAMERKKKEHGESPRSKVIAIKRTSNRTVGPTDKPAVFTTGTMTMHRCSIGCSYNATSTTTWGRQIPDRSRWRI